MGGRRPWLSVAVVVAAFPGGLSWRPRPPRRSVAGPSGYAVGDAHDGSSMPRSIVSPGGLPDLGAFVEQSPMATVYVDAELRYVRVNEEFCRFVRIPREAIIGRRVIEVPSAGFDMTMIDRVLTG